MFQVIVALALLGAAGGTGCACAKSETDVGLGLIIIVSLLIGGLLLIGWIEWQLGLINAIGYLINFIAGVPAHVAAEPCPGYGPMQSGNDLVNFLVDLVMSVSFLAVLIGAFILPGIGVVTTIIGIIHKSGTKDGWILNIGARMLLIGVICIFALGIFGRIVFALGICRYYT